MSCGKGGRGVALVRIRCREAKGKILAPPSKSYTHRGIIIASLAEGMSTIYNPLLSMDTAASIEGVKLMGAKAVLEDKKLIIEGVEQPETPADVIDAKNSGTTLRILTAVAGLVKSGYTVLTGDESLRRRPMQPLLDALQQLGVEAWSARLNGCAPVIVKGGGYKFRECTISGEISSQYISGLMIAGAKTSGGVLINITGRIVSLPYIYATMKTQEVFGAKSTISNNQIITEGSGYRSAEFKVPGDYGLAAFILAIPFIAAGEVTVEGLTPDLPQPDISIISIIKEMGGDVEQRGDEVAARHSTLDGITVSLRDAPDLLPVISVLAAVADGETVITDVRHARFKESDRISVITSELKKAGIHVEEMPDGVRIRPGEIKPATLDPHGDHRLFMAFSLLSIYSGGRILVKDPECVAISYPQFLKDLTSIGCEVEIVNDG
jgi:3-phosphoshikimate 1-carboxyvinyltransferase